MKKSTISKQWSITTDLFSTLAVKSRKLSMLWLMLLTLLLLPTSMVAQTTTKDPCYDLFKDLEGITNVTITNNSSYSWKKLDLKAEGMENLGFNIPNGSTGLMSSNYHVSNSTSEIVVKFTVEKPILLTFKYLVSSEKSADLAVVTFDNTVYGTISDKNQIEVKKELPIGKHSLKLSYKKDRGGNKYADRALIYNLKTSTTINDYVAEYDATNQTLTLTFKKFSSNNQGNLGFKYIVLTNNELTVHNICSGLGIDKTAIKNVIFNKSFNTYALTSLNDFFGGCSGLEKITGLDNLNTANVTDMEYMFRECKNLSSLDLSKFNTANVTKMSYMFYGCNKLSSLTLSESFNTANVEWMQSMFYGCNKLSSLDLSKFNTANVMLMNSMFSGCNNLSSLTLSKSFNTASVLDMASMFSDCYNLSSLDLSNFKTKNVRSMYNMFYGCSALQTIYVSYNFVTKKVSSGADMFKGCTKLKGFIDYISNPDKTDHTYANYKTGYFTELVGKNGNDKIGAVGETLTAESVALDDNKDFEAYEPFIAKDASYSRTIKEGTTWATLCLPFDVSLDGKNFRAFKLLSADEGTNTVELKEIETSIAAGTPVIIKMTNGATELNLSEANKAIAKKVQTSESANGNYQLQGLYTQKEFSKDADNNCYIVKGNKLMNPTKLLENTKVTKVVSKPFRAYMVDNSSAPTAGAKMFSIGISDSTTAIDSLNTIANDKAIYYNLQGKCLNEPQKGINIVKRNGKTMKVIIK